MMDAGSEPGATVQRHRTALVRYSLSQPVGLLVSYGLIRPAVTVYDYGCGQGDDLRALANAGIKAGGWDPHFAPESPRHPADVVNFGFVLNVIENPDERVAALRQAWSLTQRVLAVSTMIVGQAQTDAARPYLDGFLTSRGTFQKYFAPTELRDLIRAVLQAEPVAAAPGIFFVFRNGDDQEDFLIRRRIGRRVSAAAYRGARPRQVLSSRPALADRIPLALAAIADATRMRGRAPHSEELPNEVIDELARERVSLRRAYDLCLTTVLSQSELEEAAAAMREDLLVHHALAMLNRSATIGQPSRSIVWDVRAHFASHADLASEARHYLLALADEGGVRSAIAEAAAAGAGAIDHKGRFITGVETIDRLPGTLKLYLGCAAYLAGDPSDGSLVRLDPIRRRVTYIVLQSRKPAFPMSSSAIQIDLRRQTMAVTETKRQLLAKSTVLGAHGPTQRQREKRRRMELGLGNDTILARL
jgi:DNA phosphorothioation-associated putative methyltransferase